MPVRGQPETGLVQLEATPRFHFARHGLSVAAGLGGARRTAARVSPEALTFQ